MKIHTLKQGTKEWFELRRQYPLTASKAQAIGNAGKGLETLIWDVLADKYSFAEKEYHSNTHTERGNELEEYARAIYEMQTGKKVKEVGFITNSKISKVGGASPDGMIDTDGLIEIKCFDDTKHFKATIAGLVPESQYQWQMQMQMLFTERKWCDFVIYNPNFKKTLMIVRVKEDLEMQEKIKEGLKTGEKLIKEIETNIK